MSPVRRLTRGLLLALSTMLCGGAAAAPAATPPIAGSPGAADRTLAVRDGCPTFSWSEVEGRQEYEVAAYRVLEGGIASDAPLLHKRIVGAFLSWTPSLDECLPPGRYAWVVRANTAAGWTEWSEPRLFEVRGVAQGGQGPRKKADGEDRAPESGRLHSADVVELDRVFAADALPLGTSLAGGSSKLGRLYGDMFALPACTSMFTDVPPGDPACPWVEQLVRDEITEGCGSGNYCPDSPVTRRQIALLLERSMRGTDTFHPGATTADFPSPPAASKITPLQTAGDLGQYTSITIGADGLGLISYWDSVGGLRVAHCSNVECTEAIEGPVDFTLSYYTSITIGADGLALISYYDADNGDLKVAHCSNINCSDANATPLDTEGDVGQYTSIAIGADGLGLISYYDATNGDLKVVHCTNVACTTHDTPTALDTLNDQGQYTSITIGADGRGLISYFGAGLAGAVFVAHCSNTNCTAATISPPVINNIGVSSTSITTGADGLGLISFHNLGPGNLQVAHCSNTNCTAATVTVVDATGIADSQNSITIGADGLGLITYYDASNGDLKAAHCSNIDCTRSTSVALDTTGFVGQYPSITIGADGLGLISYYDATNGDLKVAHCSNVLCAPYFRRR